MKFYSESKSDDKRKLEKKRNFVPDFSKLTENNRCQFWVGRTQCNRIGTTKKNPQAKAYCRKHYQVISEIRELFP